MTEYQIDIHRGPRGTFVRQVIVQAKNLDTAQDKGAALTRGNEYVGTVKRYGNAETDFNQPIERVKLSGTDLL